MMEAAAPSIRLVSGLPLRNETSFARQLQLLRGAFEELECRSEVSGPPFEDLYLPEGGTLAGVRGGLIEAGGGRDPRPAPVRAAVLLGYPDQFPFVETWDAALKRVPTFLWTQLSRPPKSAELRFFKLVRPVALTERTWSFLAASVSRFYTGGIPIVPHGVDTTLFRPLRGDEERRRRVAELRSGLGLDGAFVVGTVASNTFRKRFDRMFEAFAIFLRRVHGAPHGSPRFVVKTDRVKGLDGRDLSEMAQRHGIASEVRFIERNLAGEELASLFCAFDLYLNLSEWEGFCVPVIEAMACGVPVASHDVQGPGELLPYADLIVPGSSRRTEEGVLLLDASPEQAAKVLERAYRGEGLRRRSSEVGRQTAVELYDIRQVARSWLNLFAGASG